MSDQMCTDGNSVDKGCSEETLNTIWNNSVQDSSHGNAMIDVNYDMDQKDGEWEDMTLLPPNLQADEAFVHTLRDISVQRCVYLVAILLLFHGLL